MTATWSTTLWLNDVDQVDVVALGLARMIWQFRGDQPRLQGALEALLDEVQNLEDVSFEVLTERWPLTAIGTQLDTIGKIVGQERGELSDDQYRLFILARILVNRSNGRIEELIDILEIVGVTDMKISEFWPAEMRISIADYPYGDLLGGLLAEAKAGGVTFRWVWSEETRANTFAFGSSLGSDTVDANKGFGDLTEATQTTGGQWSGGRVY